MNLFLVPATRENVSRSIDRGVSRALVFDYLMPTEQERLLPILGDGDVYCWAVTANQEKVWIKMSRGDEVLIAVKGTGRFDYVADILEKTIDKTRRVGKEIWSVGDEWTHIYFLTGVERIAAPKRQVLRDLGYTNPEDQLVLQRYFSQAKQSLSSCGKGVCVQKCYR